MSIGTVLVCGAGLMGHGIAQVVAAAGHSVHLFEPDVARAEAGRARIGANLERAVAKGKITADDRLQQLGRIAVATSLADAARDAELVIEAVFEDEGVKRALFAEIEAAAPASAILASNTSSISITRLAASSLSEQRRPRFVGMHFFSPVPVMPLIEIIRGAATDDATEAYVRELAAELGKQVIVSRDRPGFIVNRMVMPFLAEAMRAYEEGLATRRGHRLRRPTRPQPSHGPPRAGRLHRPRRLPARHGSAPRRLRRSALRAPPVLRQLVDAGYLGQKTGRGFYTYPRAPKAG